MKRWNSTNGAEIAQSATCWTTEEPQFDFRKRWPRPFPGPIEPSIQWLACDFAPAVKQPKRKAVTYLTPCLRKRGAMPPLPKWLHGAVLKHTHNVYTWRRAVRHTWGPESGPLNVVWFLLGNSPTSEFYIPTFRNTMFHLHKRIGMKTD